MSDYCVSPQSARASQKRPGRKLLCSTELGWRSLLVQTYEQPSLVERYETVPSTDFLVVLVDQGQYSLESLSSGTWKKAVYRPGVAGITAPMTSNVLRWSSKSATASRVIRTFIPVGFFEEATEAFRRAGTGRALRCQNILAVNDAQVTATIHSLADAIKAGIPELYAETAARYLAAHLISRACEWSDSAASWHVDIQLSDSRLRRTLEYMAWNFAEPLTVKQLAQEAGISPFHFCRVFKSQMGISPHQHLMRLRMEHAGQLLKSTDLSLADVIASCGYVHAGHFATAFYKITGKRVLEVRKDR